MAGPVELDWEKDRQRFVSRFSGPRDDAGRVADDRASLWSPLARQFADLGRDLYAVRDRADVLAELVAVAVHVVPAAAWSSVTLCRDDGPLHTASWTHEAAAVLDELQDRNGEGPFRDAIRPDGTGMAATADLANESAWPEFGPWAAEEGVRSVVSVGIFPAEGHRRGTLSVYAAEPRGLAAADPDVLLVLASFAAAAISDVDAVSVPELRSASEDHPLSSLLAIECATGVLTRRRHLEPGEAYDILRRASADLIAACRADG